MTPTACPVLLQLMSILLFPLAQTAPPAAAESTPPPKIDWKQLLADHAAYGLPPGPEKAVTALLAGDDRTMYVNGVPKTSHQIRLVFVAVRDNAPDLTSCFDGGTTFAAEKPSRLTIVAPDPQQALPESTDSSRLWISNSQACVLAIHAHRYGWTSLADALMKRAVDEERDEQRNMRYTPVYDPARFKESDPPPRAMLAWVGWRHWFGKMSQPDADLGEILPHLKMLLKDEFGLDTPTNRGWVADIEETLQPPGPRDDPYESMIDELVQWGGPTESLGWNRFVHKEDHEAVSQDALYAQLWIAGFNAVPALRKHLTDMRLTQVKRTYSNTGEDYGRLRVCDVITDLLTGLAAGELEHKSRQVDASSQLISTVVDKWWEAAAAQGERSYLLQRALPPIKPQQESQGVGFPQQMLERHPQMAAQHRRLQEARAESQRDACAVNAHVAHVIAHKYPDELPGLLQRAVKHCPETANSLLIDLLMRSELSDAVKSVALTAVLDSGAPGPRPSLAIELQKLGDPRAMTLLLEQVGQLGDSGDKGGLSYSDRWLWSRAVLLGDAAVVEKAHEVARKSDVKTRFELLSRLYCNSDANAECGCDYPDRRLSFLAAYLDDHDARELEAADRWDFESGDIARNIPKLAVRDLAALLIGSQLKLAVDWSGAKNYTDADWNKLHARVADALAKQTSPK